ncbi:MAG: hypothetical protein U5K76_12345 [Woeseiaceae bacterium]|nr:hypothetical protein [Woeseiaceae bacterium]
MYTSEKDYFAGMSRDEKIAKLKRISYTDFLRKHVGAHEDVVLILRDRAKGYWGIGYDALSAMEGYRLGMPGAWHMDLEENRRPRRTERSPTYFTSLTGTGVARAIVEEIDTRCDSRRDHGRPGPVAR